MNNLLIIVITLIFSAFFSGMEIAYVSANRLRIELDKKQGLFASRFISIFIDNPGKYLGTMLVGNNIALVIFGIAMARILGPVIMQFTDSASTILLVQTLLSTFLILVTAEFLPKIVFRYVPNQTLNIFSFPAYIFYLFFYPITLLIYWISDRIIDRFHKNDNPEWEARQVFNKMDLAHLVNQAQNDQTDESGEDNDLKLFQNALDFSSVKVRDCMVPRTEIVAFEAGGAVQDLKQKFIDSGFSKIPVYEQTVDNIIGYITSKSLLVNPSSLKDSIIEISFVPGAMSASKLLERFIKNKKSMAVVVDEFGGVSGILTIEDIIEEIFGEIEDEHDTIELVEKQISEHGYIFSGRLEIDYINEKYKLNIPESDDYETLAGFIFQHYENIPELNEEIRIEPFDIKILKVSKTKIELVQLHKTSS